LPRVKERHPSIHLLAGEAPAMEPASGAELASTLAGSSATASTNTLESFFSPEAHSWIMVPDAVDTMPGVLGFAAHEGAAALAAATPPVDEPPMSPPVTTSTPNSPTMLRETGDLAALAVSEILYAESEWPLPASQVAPSSPPPPLTCSDASYDEPPPCAIAGDPPRNEARKLGARAFPPPKKASSSSDGHEGARGCGEGGTSATEDDDDAESDDLLDDLFEPLVCWGQTWARPLAIVAVLVASHAACILLGVALGKAAQSKEVSCAAAAEGAYLTRRFSSGAGGTHARLCMA